MSKSAPQTKPKKCSIPSSNSFYGAAHMEELPRSEYWLDPNEGDLMRVLPLWEWEAYDPRRSGVDYQPIDEILVEMNMGLLFPEEKPSRSRNYYGWETDLSLSYMICDRYKLTIEVDFFKYGNYFALPQRGYPNWASRFMFSLNASY